MFSIENRQVKIFQEVASYFSWRISQNCCIWTEKQTQNSHKKFPRLAIESERKDVSARFDFITISKEEMHAKYVPMSRSAKYPAILYISILIQKNFVLLNLNI